MVLSPPQPEDRPIAPSSLYRPAALAATGAHYEERSLICLSRTQVEEANVDTSFIRGIIPAMVTPMQSDESLDRAGMKRLIGFLVEAGVHGIFTVGTAGEFWALSTEEKRQVYDWTVELTDGRLPVYLGTAANSTREAVALSKAAQRAGADCLSVLTPSFINPNGDEMFGHFADIAQAVDLPILLYDLPARTGNRLAPEGVARLAEACPNIVGIKDSSGDFQQSLEYLRLCPEGFHLVMGRDTLIEAAFAQGASAAIAASANVAPMLGVGIYDAYRKGDTAAARDFQRRLAPLRNAFTMGTHPAMLKAGADMVGAAGGPPRRPVRPLNAAQMKALADILDGIGVARAGTA